MPYPAMMFGQPPRRSRAGWIIVTLVLLFLLGGSLLLNVIFGIGMAASSVDGRQISQTTLVDGSSDQQIAVVSLGGVITDETRQRFDSVFRQIEQNNSLKGVIIDINSPGGEVTPSDEIYERISKLKRDHPNLPIAASIRGMGASGAYYAACACDHLVAQETTITGSIGVLWPNYNFSSLMQKYGVTDNTIVSSGAPFKDAGSSTKAPDPTIDGYLHGLIDAEFARFKSVVQKGRGTNLKSNIDEVANGKAYTSHEAVANGLIDEIGYLDTAISWVAKTAKLNSPQVIYFYQRTSFFDRLPFGMQHGSPETTVKINGIEVGVDRAMIDRLTHPRPMMIFQPR